MLQYGFVTIFVAAFPLAPMFALLNNVLEMRLDARKILNLHRRPVAQRVKDIGVWYNILDCLGKLSVVTNVCKFKQFSLIDKSICNGFIEFSKGLIIAFTSDFIPRLIYSIKYSADHSLEGYVNFTLAYFSTDQLNHPLQHQFIGNYSVETCRSVSSFPF